MSDFFATTPEVKAIGGFANSSTESLEPFLMDGSRALRRIVGDSIYEEALTDGDTLRRSAFNSAEIALSIAAALPVVNMRTEDGGGIAKTTETGLGSGGATVSTFWSIDEVAKLQKYFRIKAQLEVAPFVTPIIGSRLVTG